MTDDDDGPTITFGPSAADTIVGAFGWDVDNDGVIVSESGEPVCATDGDYISIDELGGIVSDDDGNPAPIRDDFSSIYNHVKSRIDQS